MTYAGIQMLMEKLNQLINCNNIPFFNHPEIIRERPQFQLLYDELHSMIQTLFIDQHQDLQKLNDLKRRFTDPVEEAQYIVDLFLSAVHNKNNEQYFPTSQDFNPSLNLDDVRRSFKSIEMEFLSMRIDSIKMDSSRRTEKTMNQYAPAQYFITKNSSRSKKLMDDIFVGLDRDAEVIRDKLVEDQKKVDVVSIVGMGGIGKTTLATKVFNDGYVKHHFQFRVWVTVSQTYDKRAVLTQILESICGQLNLEKANDSRLSELVHKNLMCKRYLIVIDDIWDIETWDNLKVFFPCDKHGSRILLTSRLTEVAKHANSNGLIHHLGYLNKEKGWELLCQKVFHGSECPEWSIKPGMQIVENCQGLPLAVVVIAGVLAKHSRSKNFWNNIAERTSLYIVGDQNGCLETLALSYHHLPLHLRECFLYLGGFTEDYIFKVRKLIWLWVAEGFIQQDGNNSLEDMAEGYLMDLIDRNLVSVSDRSKSSGAVKACKVHDLVRELCIRKAKEERFILIRKVPPQFSGVITQQYMPVRMFINEDINIPGFPYSPARNVRSILCYSYFQSLSNDMEKWSGSFVLLRVLDLQNFRLNHFPKSMRLLVHLRYLAIWNSSGYFPDSICSLWNLQTLIYITEYSGIDLPRNLSDLVNLRHLISYKNFFFFPSTKRPTNLQTISKVLLGCYCINNFPKCFPYIKELTCTTNSEKEPDFQSLIYLEKLKLNCNFRRRVGRITFPSTLKTLTLVGCGLPWSDMSIVQTLPNLQVLKLKKGAFKGSYWNANEQEFPQLKLLRLEELDIKQWEAYSRSFPCLQQLIIVNCSSLEEIPLEIGDIPTLELIQIKACRDSVGKSVRRIEEEQRFLGNYDLKIRI